LVKKGKIGLNIFVIGAAAIERTPFVIKQHIEWLGVSTELYSLEIRPFIADSA
jgi:hypothetical protein